MTPKQLHILQHSLGVDQYGQGEQYRNRFVTGPGSTDFPDCVALCEMAMMKDYGPRQLCAGDHLFVVTNVGQKAMAEHSSKPPKLSRSQKRYREYLKADSSMRFGEWLKLKHA